MKSSTNMTKSRAWRLSFRLSCAVLVCAAVLGRAEMSTAAQTTGGVNWLDPLQYEKPLFVPITVPNACTNTYYINLGASSNGSGTSASPFNGFSSLAGKPGMSGGPACVYVRGSGAFQRYGAAGVADIWGSAGNEIYIRAWPGYTATLTYNYINSNSCRFQHIIWDGGPEMGIIFVAGPSDYNGAWNFEHVASDDNLSFWTFYRTQWKCGSTSGQLFRGYGRSLNISFINSEFYDCNTGPNNVGHQIYLCGADGTAAYPGDCASAACGNLNYVFRNNIIRDNNNGLEVNMRGSTAPYQIDNLLIEGNAFRNIGKGLCGTSWACRPAITLSNTASKTPAWRNVVIRNNLVWDTASGAIWTRAGNASIYNNSITTWGVGSGSAFNQAIGGAGYSGPATVKNNLVYDGTKEPFDGSTFTSSNNLCAAGKACGANSKTYSASTVLSLDPNNANFMKIAIGSEALDAGTAVVAMTSYNGATRPQGAGFDIGAYEYASGAADTSVPTAPTALVTTPFSTTRIDLSWSAATDNVGVTGYRVFRDGAAAGTAAGLSFQDAGRTPGATHVYTVSAFDAAGNESAPSSPAVGTTLAADTTPPTVPGSLSATAQSSTSVAVTWAAATDSVGVAGYRVYRGGTLVGTVAGLTFTNTGLTPGTAYSYTVSAYDAANNESARSSPAVVTTPAPDTSPPTAPGSLSATAQSSTAVTVTWAAATDNVGVTGYRVYRGGSLAGTVTAQSFADTGLTPDTVYSYYATALDAAGNTSTASSTATARTSAVSLVGLVAAYGFNEGSGTTAADVSGNGNHGSLAGATWTSQGKTGSALSFNGSSSMVSVADAAVLRLTAGLTIEAWVNPASLSGWMAILMKEQPSSLVYGLYVNNSLNRPTGHVFVGSDLSTEGTSPIPLNTWSHLATTYDGTTLRLYVNGAQVSSRAIGGSLPTSANPLRIGGNTVWGEYFSGRIDEVRVYNRALSAVEIAADMNTPVTAADVTPPANPVMLRMAP